MLCNSISSGCGSLHLLRALGGTRILQAAAPTAPPCFRRWRRSSPLQVVAYFLCKWLNSLFFKGSKH